MYSHLTGIFLAVAALWPARLHAMELKLLDVVGSDSSVPAAAAARPPPRGRTDDPLRNFDHLWDAFDRNYAFFRERGVDWSQARARHRPRLGPASTPVELYIVCREMLGALRDDHVSLEPPEAIKDAAGPVPGEAPDPDFAELQAAIAARHAPGARMEHGGKIRWGAIDDRAAYLQINTMESFAGSSEGDVLAVRRVMESVVREFARKRLVILDLRFNGGGYDDVSLEILGRFARRPMLVFSKKLRRGDGFTPPERVWIRPAARRLECAVAVLTSPETASAAEILALAAMPMDHVTRIGSETNGILSDKEEGRMPNGWTYSLSNQVVESHDGQLYEVRGIPPHVRIDYPRDPHELHRRIRESLPGGDPAIARALLIR